VIRWEKGQLVYDAGVRKEGKKPLAQKQKRSQWLHNPNYHGHWGFSASNKVSRHPYTKKGGMKLGVKKLHIFSFFGEEGEQIAESVIRTIYWD